MRRVRCGALAAALLLVLALPAAADPGDTASAERAAGAPAAALALDAASVQTAAAPAAHRASKQRPTRSGREIYTSFRDGLADKACGPDDVSARWRAHFAHVPRQLAAGGTDVMPLFGYVVDALREAHLPTEYALIPFVESGYRPGARSASGPAGLWQFIAVTARNHEIPIRPGYDGRLSPVESTRAAVRYLKTLHGMFAGDWRLAVMAYNAGEYRVFGALKRAGQQPMTAQPETLAMPAITHAYVRKLHALSCVIKEAEQRETFMAAIDRQVPVLRAIEMPDGIADLDTLASRHETDAALLRRLNPSHADGRVPRIGQAVPVLVPQEAASAPVFLAEAPPEDAVTTDVAAEAGVPSSGSDGAPRLHVVARGESIWTIAKRYGVTRDALRARNGLGADSLLQPGATLRIDASAP
ncbi:MULTISPECIES: transglycosylase SLT domain-containing protein [Luteimonas]|uniref:transglycosylase SLT domain-containing protein n=1 Tax=Luteimonas TaxID=83614 RepID=UPI000C7C16C1|nr:MULTISPECIES: lytic transglycosylase domain-containing protein [Luteimonas]